MPPKSRGPPANEALATHIESLEHLSAHTRWRAARSLRAHAARITTAEQAGELPHIGAVLVAELRAFLANASTTAPAAQTQAPRVPPAYKPRPRSAAHALLVALHRALEDTAHAEVSLLEDELCRRAQPFTHTVMRIRKTTSSGTWHDGWSSCKTLKRHGLVSSSSRPALYCLTEEGRLVAEQCAREVERFTGGAVSAYADQPDPVTDGLASGAVPDGPDGLDSEQPAQSPVGSGGEAADAGVMRLENAGKGSRKFTLAECQRAARVVWILQSSYPENLCWRALGLLYEAGNMPDTADKLYDAMSALLATKSSALKRPRAETAVPGPHSSAPEDARDHSDIEPRSDGAGAAPRHSSVERPLEHPAEPVNRPFKKPRQEPAHGQESAGRAHLSSAVESRGGWSSGDVICIDDDDNAEKRENEPDKIAPQTLVGEGTGVTGHISNQRLPPVFQRSGVKSRSGSNEDVIDLVDSDACAEENIAIPGKHRVEKSSAAVLGMFGAEDDEMVTETPRGRAADELRSRPRVEERTGARPSVTTNDLKASQRPETAPALAGSIAPAEADCAEKQCKVILILDSMERVRRGANQSIIESMSTSLEEQGIECEVRPLPVGDALFVGRFADGNEVILDYLMERKTLEDYHASIKDGRVERQAYMMRQTRIRKKLFVLEGDLRMHAEIADDAGLRRKLCELEMCQGLYMKRTKDLTDTTWLYGSMFRRLRTRFERKRQGYVMQGREGFAEWNERMGRMKRGLTLEQLFYLQMCQLKGISKISAKAVLRMGFRTPQALFRALDQAGEGEARDLLLKKADGRIGSRVSRMVGQLFSAPQYDTRIVRDGGLPGP